MSTLIHFENVSKRYRVGAGHKSLREAIQNWPKRLLNIRRGETNGQYIWALKDVNFEVNKGETLGIIGHNGAGKTTILKLLSRVVRPTAGKTRVNGRVAALIELGAGFHPELSGRENIYLNGVILGLNKKQINKKFDSIVAFAELEKFIDMPVKRYSSGMYARLGFSVAAHVDPDILLVDEVLAVGDAAFQTRCLQRIADLSRNGTRIVFVSHNLGAIQEVCNRAIWLAQGQIQAIDEPKEVIHHYLDHVRQTQFVDTNVSPSGHGSRQGSLEAVITGVTILDAENRGKNVFTTGEPMRVRICYEARTPVQSPVFGVSIFRNDDLYCYGTNTKWDGQEIRIIQGTGAVEFYIPSLPLLSGTYALTVGLMESQAIAAYDFHHKAYPFEVRAPRKDYGILYVEHQWILDCANT